MNTEKLATFKATYIETLKARIQANPENYPWVNRPTVIHGNAGQTVLPAKTPETFAEKFIQGVVDDCYTFSGNDTLKATCKRLGVKPTQKDLNAWLNG